MIDDAYFILQYMNIYRNFQQTRRNIYESARWIVSFGEFWESLEDMLQYGNELNNWKRYE
jgi:hypothetical protein